MVSVAFVVMPFSLFGQEGDDGFSSIKSKIRPYGTVYLEKRLDANSANHALESGNLSWGYAFGLHFRFAHFLTPIRFGFWRQESLTGTYSRSEPAEASAQGLEFSLGYNNDRHVSFFVLFRGGKYGTETWQVAKPDNHLTGFVGLGILYRFNLGSDSGGFAFEPALLAGGVDNGVSSAFSLTGRPYW